MPRYSLQLDPHSMTLDIRYLGGTCQRYNFLRKIEVFPQFQDFFDKRLPRLENSSIEKNYTKSIKKVFFSLVSHGVMITLGLLAIFTA